MTGCKADRKTFTSPDKKLRLTLPLDWEEYDDDEENTFAFFNAKSWTGNFRVTPFYWTQKTDNKTNKAIEFVQDELDENPDAKRLSIGGFDCAHYKKNVTQDNEQLVIYYWAVGLNDNLFVCSFTVDKVQESTEQNLAELKTVEEIIASIKVS